MKNRLIILPFTLSISLIFCSLLSFAQSDNIIGDEWLILGPIPVEKGKSSGISDQAQLDAFDLNYLDPQQLGKIKAGKNETIDGETYAWKSVKEQNDIIDLEGQFPGVDYAAAYGFTELVSEVEKKVMLGVGSDDGIRIWFNGELVHDNRTPRGVTLDDDLVPVTLLKGNNQLLLKVQDIQQGWGFSCRVIQPEALMGKLTGAAAKGQLEDVKMLLSYGADINGKDELGLTALQRAYIGGREEIVHFLINNGADDNIPMPDKESLADKYFQNLTAEFQPEPGAAVLVSKDGKILYEKGFGMANLDENIPITVETEFRIGSITKQFTASAILKLHEEGKIDLDDKLSKFIPDYPRGDEVTIHHLLTHTSGIKSYTDKIDFNSQDVQEPIASTVSHIESFKNDPYNFNPGESWSYNNSGYFLLSFIIEKVSGQSYGDYLNEQFFSPLGMDHTGVHYGGINLTHEATGYSYQDGKAVVAPNWEMSWAGGAGALYSTLDDLYKWNEAVFCGKVLEESSLEAAFTPVKLNDGSEASAKYGYGWFMTNFRGWESISHSGGLPGFVTNLIRFPKQNVSVAILSNATPPLRINPAQASLNLAELFFWEEMDPQESFVTNVHADTSDYKDYVGRYAYPGGAIMVVTVENGKLFAQLTGQPKFEIFPQEEERFFWKVVDAQVKFVRNDAGEIAHAVHTQAGQTFDAPKMEEEEAVEINPEIMEKYAGLYNLNGSDVNITKENDKLWIQVTGQPKFQLFPRSETEFFLKEVNASLTFTMTENGEIEKLILDQAGQKFDIAKQ